MHRAHNFTNTLFNQLCFNSISNEWWLDALKFESLVYTKIAWNSRVEHGKGWNFVVGRDRGKKGQWVIVKEPAITSTCQKVCQNLAISSIQKLSYHALLTWIFYDRPWYHDAVKFTVLFLANTKCWGKELRRWAGITEEQMGWTEGVGNNGTGMETELDMAEAKLNRKGGNESLSRWRRWAAPATIKSTGHYGRKWRKTQIK